MLYWEVKFVGNFEKTYCLVCHNEAILIQRSGMKKCPSCWAYYGDFVSKANNHNKRAIALGLPGYLAAGELEFLFHKYNKSCVLTGSTNVVIDHFIPLDTGYGGTYLGNIVFLDRSLHERKVNKNPFVWLSENTDKFSMDKVFRLISDLAEQNGISISEYERFVKWCYENPLTGKGQLNYRQSSIDLWKESLFIKI